MEMTKSTTPKNIVLYVDDDPDDLYLVQESFAKFANNVEVIIAHDGIKGLSYLRGLSDLDPIPCLVILDINMPFISGKEVLIEIRKMERFKSVPVVLFTTSSMPADKSFAVYYNAGIITKPLDVKQMEQITSQFIDHCAEEIRKNIKKYLQ